MGSTVDLELVAKFVQRLKNVLRDKLNDAERRAIYEHMRQNLAQEYDGLSRIAFYPIRLAAEYAIQDSERNAIGGAVAQERKSDVWSLLDPTSQHYALEEVTPLSGATAVVMDRGKSRGAASMTVMGHLGMIASLWLHGMNREASQDRIGYVWLVMDPLIQIMVITIVPLFLHAEQIYDMATFPFAVIGACFWLVFRVSAFGALSGGGVLKPQLEHPAVRRFDIMVARALNALVNYFIAGTCLLGIAIFLGLTGPPLNLPLFVLCFLTSWVIGLSYGTVINSLVRLYPGLRRVNAYSLRFIGLMSALFYTPEQLPEAVADVIWYNPLLHIVQLARTAWFPEYSSDRVSLIYILFWTLTLALLALVCMVIDERRPDTVRA